MTFEDYIKIYMGNGYKILWTEHALKELATTYEYLEANFSSKELEKLSIAIDNTLKLISRNPHLLQASKAK